MMRSIRMLGLACGLMKLLILVAKFVSIVQQIMGGATNYHARHVLA